MQIVTVKIKSSSTPESFGTSSAMSCDDNQKTNSSCPATISKSLSEFINKNSDDLSNLFTVTQWGDDELSLVRQILAELPEKNLNELGLKLADKDAEGGYQKQDPDIKNRDRNAALRRLLTPECNSTISDFQIETAIGSIEELIKDLTSQEELPFFDAEEDIYYDTVTHQNETTPPNKKSISHNEFTAIKSCLTDFCRNVAAKLVGQCLESITQSTGLASLSKKAPEVVNTLINIHRDWKTLDSSECADRLARVFADHTDNPQMAGINNILQALSSLLKFGDGLQEATPNYLKLASAINELKTQISGEVAKKFMPSAMNVKLTAALDITETLLNKLDDTQLNLKNASMTDYIRLLTTPEVIEKVLAQVLTDTELLEKLVENFTALYNNHELMTSLKSDLSPLQRLECLLRLVQEQKLGSMLSENINNNLQPVCSALDNAIKLLDIYRDFPATSEISNQITWFSSKIQETPELISWLPNEAIKELFEDISTFTADNKTWPKTQAEQVAFLVDSLASAQAQKYLPDSLVKCIGLIKLAHDVHQEIHSGNLPAGAISQAQYALKHANNPAIRAFIEAVIPESLHKQFNDVLKYLKHGQAVINDIQCFPAQTDNSSKAQWAARLLSNPDTLGLLNLIVDKQWLAPLELLRNAQTYPVTGSITERLRWVIDMVKCAEKNPQLKSLLPAQLNSFINGTQHVLPVLDAYISLPKIATVAECSKSVASALSQLFKDYVMTHPELLLMVTKAYPPLAHLGKILNAYNRVPAGLGSVEFTKTLAMEVGREILGPLSNMWSLGKKMAYLKSGVTALRELNQLRKEWTTDPIRAELRLQQITKPFATSESSKKGVSLINHLPALYNILSQLETKKPGGNYKTQDIDPVFSLLKNSKSPLLRKTLSDLEEKASTAAADLITANLDTAILIGGTAVAAKYKGAKTAAAVAVAGGAALWASKVQAVKTEGAREKPEVNIEQDSLNSPDSFPHRDTVKNDISAYVHRDLTTYSINFSNSHSNPTYTSAVINSVRNNIDGLIDEYEKKYKFVYQNRTNPDLDNIIYEAKNKFNLSDTPDDELWENREFSIQIIFDLLAGKIIIDGEQVCQPFNEIVTDLFSPTPPLESGVSSELKDKLDNILLNEIDKYEFSDGGAEVLVAAKNGMERLLKTQIDTYTDRYLNMHESVTTTDDDKFTTNLSNYAFWHTSDGQKEAARLLSEGVNEKISTIFQQAVTNTYADEPLVKKTDIDKAAIIFNDLVRVIKAIRNEYDLNKLADICITQELKSIAGMTYPGTNITQLTPDQLSPDGKILVGFLGGSKRILTMRDIGLGRPARIGTVYEFGVQDNVSKLSGKKIVKHSNAFDKFLLYLPDKVEAFLTNKVNELSNMLSLPTYHELSIKTALEEFKKHPKWSRYEAIYSDAIDKFMRGEQQPELMKVRFKDSSGKKHVAALAEIIAIKGKDGSYLTVSVKNGAGVIIPGDAKKIHEKHKEWILQHMSLYDAGREPVLKAFVPQRHHDKMTGKYHRKPFEYPIEFSRANDYKQQLSEAFSARKNSDINTLIKNSHERLIDTALDWSTLAASVLAMAIPGSGTAIGAVLQLLLGVGVGVSAEIGKFMNADTVEGKQDAFWGAFSEILAGGLDIIDAATTVVKALKKRMAKEIISEGPKASKHIDFVKKSNTDDFNPEVYINKNTINQTASGDIYPLDDLHTITDYNINLFDKNALSVKANNNTIALNRIYGEGTAELIIHRQDDLAQSLAVKVKDNQKSLDALLNNGELDTVNTIVDKISAGTDIEKIADDLANSLRDKGITLKERGIPISYNKSTSQFELRELDSVNIIPKENGIIRPLTDSEVLNLKNDFITSLTNFRNKVSTQKVFGTFQLHKPQKFVMPSDLPDIAIGSTANICRRVRRSPTGVCAGLNMTKQQLRDRRKHLDDALKSPEIQKFWDDLKIDNAKKGVGTHPTIKCLKDIESYYYKVKKKLYRGHTIKDADNLKDIGIRRRASINEDVTDVNTYLKNIIVHTGGTGTGGKALSFSTDVNQSYNFFTTQAKPGTQKVFLEIDIKDALKKNPDLFMTTPKLLKHYGGYLMSTFDAKGNPLMNMSELKDVLKNIFCAFTEREVFYLGQFTKKGLGWGEIPVNKFDLNALDNQLHDIDLKP
ncbi:hypothetical protein PUG81_03430 [Erwiniaceae bacterium L1_54_6]|nr:hypothetical protein [Erwiniaceae bacterium L1_54_6]